MSLKMNKDCFAYKNGHCDALYSVDCTGCKFYKTVKQHKKDVAKAKRNLNERLGFLASEMEYEALLEYLASERE